MSPIGLVIIGAGYWGPNLVRSALATPELRLEWLCDLDIQRAQSVLGPFHTIGATSCEEVRADSAVDTVETSLTELAQTLLSVMGSDVPLEYGPSRGVNAVTRRLAGVSLAAERLGWRAEVGLEEGLKRLVSWWRALNQVQPAWRSCPADIAGWAD